MYHIPKIEETTTTQNGIKNIFKHEFYFKRTNLKNVNVTVLGITDKLNTSLYNWY